MKATTPIFTFKISPQREEDYEACEGYDSGADDDSEYEEDKRKKTDRNSDAAADGIQKEEETMNKFEQQDHDMFTKISRKVC